MSDPDRVVSADVAGLAAAIERAAADLAVAEEPAGFVVALEGESVLVTPLRIPDPRPLVDVCNVISRSESAAVHARLVRERPHELQPAVRSRLEIGFRISAHDYLQALRLRARFTREFIREVFGEVDALVLPVIPEPAPALAVPSGLSSDGRPLALQIVGRAFDEATVLRVGHAYQRVTAWHLEPPRFSGRGGPVIG